MICTRVDQSSTIWEYIVEYFRGIYAVEQERREENGE